jgi:hypothetical protein
MLKFLFSETELREGLLKELNEWMYSGGVNFKNQKSRPKLFV